MGEYGNKMYLDGEYIRMRFSYMNDNILFSWVSFLARLNSHYEAWIYKKKDKKKDEKNIGKLIKIAPKKLFIKSRLKAT